MSFKIKLFDENIMKTLRKSISLSRKPSNDYVSYLGSEYSRLRLTHDILDNPYFRGVSVFNNYDYLGLAEQEVKAKSR